VMPADYNFEVPTCVAYRHPDYIVENARGTSAVTTYDASRHGSVHGEFASIRRALDYTWHTNYSLERQAWQDRVVRRAVPRSLRPQERPWVVFTCGAMGSGKGHVMSWLSRHNAFPLDNLIRIDPDHFKIAMPEWNGYKRHSARHAGTLCHMESGFLQELAQEIAMRSGRHVWIDGSLGDSDWYASTFAQMRTRFPDYRLAIVYVRCSPEKVFERAERRGKETGRFIPRELLVESIESTRRAIEVLGPLADFVAKVNNDSDTPRLEVAGAASKEVPPPFLRRPPPEELWRKVDPLADFIARVNSQFKRPWIEVWSSPRLPICDRVPVKRVHASS